MKATALAPANIAFIKYWGRKDQMSRIPRNASISMNLSACTTTTTIDFSPTYSKDTVFGGFNVQEEKRIIDHIDRVRNIAGIRDRAHIMTENSFPKSAGIASSASGFAALTAASVSALGLTISERELTGLARLGSGSACRSIPDGFVKWEGEYARTLFPPDHWTLCDIIVIVDKTTKDISSSEGHDRAESSPFFINRLQTLPERILRCEKALKSKNFDLLGEVIEEDCLDMHHVMQTQNPPLMYWNSTTKKIMDSVKVWRTKGIPVYFTIDAGPNVHLICERKDEDRVMKSVKKINGIQKIIPNSSSKGTHVVNAHLF